MCLRAFFFFFSCVHKQKKMNEEVLVVRLPSELASMVNAALSKHSRTHTTVVEPRVTSKVKPVRGVLYPRLFSTPKMQEVWGKNEITDVSQSEEIAACELLDLIFPEGDDGVMKQEAVSPEHESGLILQYRCLDGKDHYAFQIGQDEFHATKVRLPKHVEIHLTDDKVNLVSFAHAKHMLVVSERRIDEPRPPLPGDGGGVTLPACRLSPPSSIENEPPVPTMDEVHKADTDLAAFAQLLVDIRNPTGTARSSVHFVHEEMVTLPPWMEYAEENLVFMEGDDDFDTSVYEAQERAMKRKEAYDMKQKLPLLTATTMRRSVSAPVQQHKS